MQYFLSFDHSSPSEMVYVCPRQLLNQDYSSNLTTLYSYVGRTFLSNLCCTYSVLKASMQKFYRFGFSTSFVQHEGQELSDFSTITSLLLAGHRWFHGYESNISRFPRLAATRFAAISLKLGYMRGSIKGVSSHLSMFT